MFCVYVDPRVFFLFLFQVAVVVQFIRFGEHEMLIIKGYCVE